ncbi:MAG: restriction endonuclease subunit S [Paludibacteraceae bacterium]|nr:restriction endonuclease subunit S [Paludibacteraceae bacterium]
MKRYDTYKPSEIEWLGEIPEHWEVKRVKEIGNVVLGKMLCNTPQPGYLLKPYLKSKNIGWIRVNVESVEEMYFSKVEMKQYKIKKNDLLLSEGGEVGKTCIWNDEIQECYIQNSVHKISFPKYVEAKYYLYFSFATGVLGGYDSIVNFISIKHLTYEKLNRILWTFPPFQEQTAIANYLDTKTAAIDRKIELLTAKADKYKALRRSLISETVCRGLPASEGFTLNETLTKMKVSGIEWIGMIPEHWEVKRFKSIANTVKGRNLELSDTYFENSLPNLSLEYLRNESVTFDTYCYAPDKNQRVTTNDMIIIWDGAGVGEILKGKEGFLSSTIAKIVVDRKKYNSKFLYHLRFSIEYILKMIPAGMGIPHLNPQVLNSFNCPCPPLEEQEKIASYLDNKTTQIDTILTNINNQINKLTQLRKTLINDVVTGKIKVTEVDIRSAT